LALTVRRVMTLITLSTRKLSGVTSPDTTPSPNPQALSMATADRSPLPGLRVNATPADRGLTIFCTATHISTSRWL
jgi:hypothetical protein